MKIINLFKKSFVTALVVMVAFVAMPSVITEAAAEYQGKTYTVTYRPGNVGYFALPNTTETEKDKMALEVAELLFTVEESGNAPQAIVGMEVTKNGAIKLEVKEGALVPEASVATYVVTSGDYFVKAQSEWGPSATDVVKKNIDFVVDYGRLIDGVEYTVQFVDTQSGTAIAPTVIAYGNIGEEVNVTAPSTLVISGSTYYTAIANTTTTIKLDANAQANIVTFSYEATTYGEEVREVVNTLPGDTVTLFEEITTPTENAGAVLAPGQVDTATDGEIEILDGETPLADNENTDTEDEVQILDQDVPLEDGSQALNEDMEIEESEVPLASSVDKVGIQLYMTIAIMLLLAVGLALVLIKLKNNKLNNDSKGE